MKEHEKACLSCGSKKLVTNAMPSGGGHAPSRYLLEGLGGFWKSASVDVVLCADCGYLMLYASKEALARLPGNKHWERA